jgi:hypothetical protein
MKQVLLLILLITVNADLYLSSIRGGNNRLDEANRERNNANRMFDSQNNNRGGYNVGKLTFFQGEEIPVSWTLQHGCGTDDVKHCEVIVQMMCDPLMRDGTTTQRIPDNPANCRNFNCDLDPQFGRHESYAFYETCKTTQRNQGLYTSSQNLGPNQATRTRQNPGGTRSGYECPEERDYYPYWRPSPWMDLAIFTRDTAKCEEYRAHSENVEGRWYCDVPEYILEEIQNGQRIPIQEAGCLQLNEEFGGGSNANKTLAEWKQAPSHGVPAPECFVSEASRPNHLGLIGHDKQWTWNMVVPDWIIPEGEESNSCALRMRYNITQDYSPYTAENNLIPNVNATHNPEKNNPNANNDPSMLPVWEEYGLTWEEVEESFPANNVGNDDENRSRDYVYRNNPQVDILGLAADVLDTPIRLQLAINTAQFGRTFQDRTHMMTFRKRPDNIPADANIKLVTVSGKRGNIVQTFPGHEYFMVPETAHFKTNDYVHFMWSGSNTNPNNNDGQGKQGTDRSNIVPLRTGQYAGATDLQGEEHGNLLGSYPAYVRQPEAYSIPQVQLCGRTEENGEPIMYGSHVASRMGGLSEDVIMQLATGRQVHDAYNDYGNMEELDDAGASFSLEPQKVTEEGCWNYVSTRNNNFSNRSQKGKFCVSAGEFEVVDIGSSGGTLMTDSGWVYVEEEALEGITAFSFRSEPGHGVSQTVFLEPVVMNLAEDAKIEFAVQYEKRALRIAEMKYRETDDDSWESVGASFKMQDGATVAVANVDKGGQYVVEDKIDGAAVAAIVIGSLFVVVTVVGLIYCKMFGSKSNDLTQGMNNGSVQQQYA